MKPISLFCAALVFLTPLVRGAVSARNGIAVTTLTAVNGRSSNWEINGQQIALHAETTTWYNLIVSLSGAANANSRVIANNLILSINAASYGSKIVYLLPFLGQNNGANLNAAFVPLRDSLVAGSADNVSNNLVAADFSEATGLQGDGSSKRLDTKLKPSQLGSGNNGGIGFWENNINFTGTSSNRMAGCASTGATSLFTIEAFAVSGPGFQWSASANGAFSSPAAGGTNAHYYGNRSSATSRVVYKNGSQTGSNTTNDTASGSSDTNLPVLAYVESSTTFWAGRCAAFYLTDGTMSGADAANFHTLLIDYLFTPTGRPSS